MCCAVLCWLQYYQTAEDLGLYGQDPTATASKGVYVATGIYLTAKAGQPWGQLYYSDGTCVGSWQAL